MKKITGDQIVELLGLSESDDKILDLFNALGVDKKKIVRDEDLGDFDISLMISKDGNEWLSLNAEDILGSDSDWSLSLEFSCVLPDQYEKQNIIGGQYLKCIDFKYTFKPFPYGLTDKDGLKIIEKKLGLSPQFIDIEDDNKLHWIYRELGWLTIVFEDNTYTEIYSLRFNLYEDPEENFDGENGFGEIMKPFKH